MDDVTDTVFRNIVRDCSAPDLFFTEFVNVDGLQSAGRNNLLKKLKFSKLEKPIIAQLWGKIPENYYKTTKELIDMGFDGVDINMGCPDRTIVKNGCCVGLVNNRPLAKEIIDAVKDGANEKIPVSVKTRLGLNEIDFTWHEFLLNQGLNALTIHGRTAKQMSLVPNSWQAIDTVRTLRDKFSPDTLVIGNGDIMNRKHGLELAEEYKLDGLMIGRGIFHDPFAFANNSPWEEYSKEDRLKLFQQQVELFKNTWKNSERPLVTLNKFAKIYINNFENAKELREKVMNAHSVEQLLQILDTEISRILVAQA